MSLQFESAEAEDVQVARVAAVAAPEPGAGPDAQQRRPGPQRGRGQGPAAPPVGLGPGALLPSLCSSLWRHGVLRLQGPRRAGQMGPEVKTYQNYLQYGFFFLFTLLRVYIEYDAISEIS